MSSTPLHALGLRVRNRSRELFPGVIVATLVAVSAQFLAEHYATPAMLLALLLGIAVNFLSEEERTGEGIAFSARSLLRLGVALLGVRISLSLMLDLGGTTIALVLGAVVLTIGFGLSVARLFGHRWRFALLTSGAVAICGASAAVALSAVLPKDRRSEERLIFTVLGVTVLSTLAMIAYPIAVRTLALDDVAAGVFLGGTIHDVAQVVGAGYSMSDQVGDTATLIKLFRVAMLAPVVIVVSLLVRRTHDTADAEQRPPLLPPFVVGFLVLAILNSLGWIPSALADFLGQSSRWLLLTAISAVGMKTKLQQVLSVGGAAIALIVVETLFLAGLILLGIRWIG